MGKYPTPTLEDLARLMDTAAGGDYHRGARDTARWLVEESAPELYAELVVCCRSSAVASSFSRTRWIGTTWSMSSRQLTVV